MKDNNYINPSNPEQEEQLFAGLEVPYSQSKEDIWEKMERRMAELPVSPEEKGGRVIRMRWGWMSAAAAIVLLACSAALMRGYTLTINGEKGELASHVLPDGSEVQLNEGATLSYAPYGWWMSRELSLEGEAFFQVTKGKRFAVYSQKGTTEVLGTSFNISANATQYQVYCSSGKVRVTNNAQEAVILTSGELATINEANDINEETGAVEEQVLAWKQLSFDYNAVSLVEVLEELEQYYGIRFELKVQNPKSYQYTGSFKRSLSAKEALEIICFSFDLQFVQENSKSFVIMQ